MWIQNLISVSIVLRQFLRTRHLHTLHNVTNVVHSKYLVLFMRPVSTESHHQNLSQNHRRGLSSNSRSVCSCVPGTCACSPTPFYKSPTESPYACCVLMTYVLAGAPQKKHPCHRCRTRKDSDSGGCEAHGCADSVDTRTASCSRNTRSEERR